jgi:hypothetical protein
VPSPPSNVMKRFRVFVAVNRLSASSARCLTRNADARQVTAAS